MNSFCDNVLVVTNNYFHRKEVIFVKVYLCGRHDEVSSMFLNLLELSSVKWRDYN